MNRVISYGFLGSLMLYLGRRFFRGTFVSSELMNKKDLSGQVVLVTGCSRGGIGYETVKALYLRGAQVVVAVRDKARSEKEFFELLNQHKGEQRGFIVVMKVDLDDLESVREFAKEFLQRFNRLDILINNAGLGGADGVSKQGYETHFAVNHLSHFLLVHYLRQLILDTSVKYYKECKIINVGSAAHMFVRKEEHLNFTKERISKADPTMFAYGQSKLCNLLFTKSLARQLQDSKVGVYVIHPGAVQTNFFRRMPIMSILNWIVWYFFKTPEGGAQTQIHVALESMDKLRSGGYYSDCGLARETSLANNVDIQDKLWNFSEELCKDYM
ncbi:predicted protein [Naegleria gruberi]|uniref:Predicted protein n=1 Tax=Naegleria gruberi TaxID=5762 RepID=D2VGC9_NAEGR|nr:uncharacterized protein NAEGRDRAFT_44570 [Naegleria gruberi]EFC43940.1 predicted protein [Naegleria gruberi]|eukprot:XP_002676684.1 predicted protein [Naegleria gruberi strain NEG-M]